MSVLRVYCLTVLNCLFDSSIGGQAANIPFMAASISSSLGLGLDFQQGRRTHYVTA